MEAAKYFNIPPVKSTTISWTAKIESLEPGYSMEMGEYSYDLMHIISATISRYKKKKGNSKKVFRQRQEKKANGDLFINLYRIK